MSSLTTEVVNALSREEEGRAVSFRPMDAYDADRVYEWLNDERTHRFLYWRPSSLEEARMRVEMWLNAEDAVHLMILRQGEEVGFLHLEHVDPQRRQVWLGLVVIDPEHAHRGLGTCALSLLTGKLREAGLLDRALLSVNADNGPALTVYDRVGFRRIDTRLIRYPHGSEVEQYIMEVDLRKTA
jgi:RimJ/RimL family protein N-acetyltransferase